MGIGSLLIFIYPLLLFILSYVLFSRNIYGIPGKRHAGSKLPDLRLVMSADPPSVGHLKLKLKQQEFAGKLGISGPSLSEIETGKYKPCHDFFYNIVKTYDVNLYYLLFGEGAMFRDPTVEVPGFSGRLTELVSRNPDAHRFLYYFENSPIVQYYIMGLFRRYMNDEQEAIDKDIEQYKKE